MLNLYKVSVHSESSPSKLTHGEKLSVAYHNVFDFPLSVADLIKWKAGENMDFRLDNSIVQKSGYFYLEGSEGIIYKRMLRKRISAKKNLMAKKAAKYIGYLPTVKMVALTGSLAMDNSSDTSDIDFLIVASKGTLWTTRILVYCLLKILNMGVRKSDNRLQKDRLCLNMWMDESDLVWNISDRNLYTAHEIAQVKPLINKNKTYEKFLRKNKWILGFWPNAVKIGSAEEIKYTNFLGDLLKPVEVACFKLQFKHMRKKITREVVSKTRAIFHPLDWGSVVIGRLTS